MDKAKLLANDVEFFLILTGLFVCFFDKVGLFSNDIESFVVEAGLFVDDLKGSRLYSEIDEDVLEDGATKTH